MVLRECKVCGVEKEHINTGFYIGNTKNFLYIGADKLRWHGRTCGSCHVTDQRGRAADKADSKSFKPKRKCRKCNKNPPPTRYFDCEECKPVLPSDDLMLQHWNLSGTVK